MYEAFCCHLITRDDRAPQLANAVSVYHRLIRAVDQPAAME
jgi:hypothetical protein